MSNLTPAQASGIETLRIVYVRAAVHGDNLKNLAGAAYLVFRMNKIIVLEKK